MTDDASSNEFRERFLALRDSENAKNKLIDELLSNLDALSQNFQQISFDREREIYVNREIQREKKLLSDEIRKMKASSARRSKSLPLEREVDCEQDRNPFIVVLIDGDGTIFQDSLLQQGEAGGREAAGLLWSAIRQYAERDLADLPSDCKIVARIYANIKGLAETCHKAGIVDHPTKVVDFARGFTRSKHLFDFIDVGSGKDRADDKLAEVFKLHLYDGHCRQIIFGCSHDNGYARLLEEYFADQATASRISLLEGVPFERELEGLRPGFKNTRIDSLFRNTKINLQAQQYQPQYQPPAAPQQQSTPQYAPLTRKASNSATYVTPNVPSHTSPTSWASAATMPPPIVASPPPTPKPTSNTLDGVPRNRYGQRVDPELQFDRSDIGRIKGFKLCNVHYLRKECQYGYDCPHDHSYQPTKSELLALRYLARLIPCRFGTECDDPKCTMGHRCFKGNSCPRGQFCRFSDDLHEVDTRVVKSIKV